MNINNQLNILRKLLLQNKININQARKISGLDSYNAERIFKQRDKNIFIPTLLKNVKLIKLQRFEDNRGFFISPYSKELFKKNGIYNDFIQDNHSLSISKGVLRGLHFQLPPYEQAKLVRVLKGSVYDVVVDLRKDSPTFGMWEGFELSSQNGLSLYIPRGFAHGFITLENHTEFEYKIDNYYSPENEAGIIWNDPALKINWPIKNPILSEKDKLLPRFINFKSPF